jgi:dihydrofolate reductase
MGKLVSNFFMSLDGVVESPDQWHFDYWNEEMEAAMGRELADIRGFMMGRTLYGEWSEYWPAHADDEFGQLINSVPKYVVSNSLTDTTWAHTTVVPGGDDLATRIRAVKAGTDGTIGISGSATLVRSLLDLGVIDQLNLMVHPIAVGKGQRLFEDTPKQAFRLDRQEIFRTGVLNLTYVPA